MSNQHTRYHMYVSFQDDDKIAIFTMDPATGGAEAARLEIIGLPGEQQRVGIEWLGEELHSHFSLL